MSEENDYVAVCPNCRRIVGWTMTDRVPLEDLASNVASWIKQGFELTRMTTDTARTLGWRHAEWCEWPKERTEGT